ncbi:MAG: transcriptional regulator PpsR [Pseudomonadota bacterium]
MLSSQKTIQFSKPENHLPSNDAETLGAIIATASDIALVIDAQDRIQDFAAGIEGIEGTTFSDWVGRSVEDIVTTESRPKIREMLETARRGDIARWREINHPITLDEGDFPVRYCAVRADEGGSVLLLGRDLRAMAALQRRLVSVQQSLERDYARLLQMETRYRLLFQSATEAFLIVDGQTLRILEANDAAADLLGRPTDDLLRRKFPFGFSEDSSAALDTALTTVRASGRPETITAAFGKDDREISVFLSLFRVDNARQYLIRLTPPGQSRLTASQSERQIVGLFRRASEAIVLTDGDGRIEWANDSFLDLAQVAVETQLRGETIDRFFSRQGIDLPLILSNTRESGRLRFYSSSLSGMHGLITDIEVSCVAIADHGRRGFGFVFRNTAFRPPETGFDTAGLPRSAEQLTDLIGRVPLKDLVRDTVDVIERLCIESALRMTNNNRASAADLLGLSRQSLYVKLRRYGITGPYDDDTV